MGRYQGDTAQAARGWSRRRRVCALLLVTAVSLLGVGVPVVSPTQLSLAPVVHADPPKPGEPGGNHSSPGDNKKKNRQRDGDNNNGYFDRDNGGNQRPGQQSQQQRPTSRVDATQIDRTEQNNRLTPDGDNRSVGIQNGNDGAARQSAPDQQPPNAAQPDPDRTAEPPEGPRSAIPPRQELSPEQRAAYNNIRNLPTDATRKDLAGRVNDGLEPYNKDPYNTGTDTDLNAVADHLVPKRRIAEMPGFADLDRETQRQIADSPENIYAAAPFENSSRRDSTFSEYFANGQGAQLDPAYREMRIAQENEAYGFLQQRIDQAWAQQYGRPRVTNGPVEVDLSQPPLEVNPRPSPPELPALQAPPELPVTRGPVEMPPISVAPQLPPPGPTIAYPLPPVRPATPPVIGAPVAPTTMPAPPPAIIPTPPAPGFPAQLPAWSTPPVGPLAIPTVADPLAALRAEQSALGIEASTILDRQEALQALPGFDTNPAAIAEYQALQSLAPQIAARQGEIGGVLANPPAALAPPPSLWQQTVSGAKAVADAVGSAVSSVWGAISGSGAVPVPVGPAIPIPVP